MKIHTIKIFATTVVLTFLAIAPALAHNSSKGYPINAVPFTKVTVADKFWSPRLEVSRNVTIPLAFSKCEETGRYKNFENAAHPSDTIKVGGFPFDDTDVYKTIEGASYLLQTYPDKNLEAYIDSILTIVAAAQEPDGYLYTSRTMNPAHPHDWAGARRWDAVENLSHEFYNLGHMVEGAIAHYQATGKRNFLDIAIRYADCIVRNIGLSEGQTDCVPGHQIAEMALAKLYLVTGEQKYLDQAKYFLDRRGYTSRRDEYSQAHKPVIEQDEAVGHAVRAAYMYAGMADVAALSSDCAYINAIDRIWNNIVSKKMYITGGIGSTSHGEAFGKNYELPNMSAYCETCAAIGNVYVNHRLFLLHGESKYYDVLERTLYNGLISGVSMDGGSFFYPNPLESAGQHQRQPWFGCACCPSNICRFIPSLPGYVYAATDNDVYINLFMGNRASLPLKDKSNALEISQSTDYPLSGKINIDILRNHAGEFNLKIRIPGWVQNSPVPSDLYSYIDEHKPGYTIWLNGEKINPELQKGYATIHRKWRKGDKIEILLDMSPRLVTAHSNVLADRGRVAIERGPLVYCAEWPDNGFNIQSALLNRNPQFSTELDSDMLGGIVKISTPVQKLKYNLSGQLDIRQDTLTLIPYYTWCHRGAGQMMVWLPRDLQASKPEMAISLATAAQLSASVESESLKAVNDGEKPIDSEVAYFHFNGSTEPGHWIQYDFPEATFIKSSTVHWYDNAPWGEIRQPQNWNLSYRDTAGKWYPVGFNAIKMANPDADTYPISAGSPSATHFDPVEATAIRLNVTNIPAHPVGIERQILLFLWQMSKRKRALLRSNSPAINIRSH